MKTNLSKLTCRLIMLMAAAVLLAFNLTVANAQSNLPGAAAGVGGQTPMMDNNSTPTLNAPVSSCTGPDGSFNCQVFESDAAGNPSEQSNSTTLADAVRKGYVVLLERPTSDPNDQSQWSDILVFGANGQVLSGITRQMQLISDGCGCFPSVATVNSSNHVYIVQTQTGFGNDDTDVTHYDSGGNNTNNQYFIHSDAELEFIVNYFAGANGARPDQTVRITNPGTAVTAGGVTADLCANIYVFSPDQQLAECCSCLVTPDGLRTLSVNFDLAHNPLTPVVLGEGVIKIVSSNVNATGAECPLSKAGTAYQASWVLRAWGTHNQDVSGGLQGTGVVNQVTETHFLDAKLSGAELSSLQSNCAFIFSQGSGHGICSCGRGD